MSLGGWSGWQDRLSGNGGNFLRWYLLLFLFLLVGFILFKYVIGFFLPFLLGLGLALVVDPVVNWLEERGRLPRGVAAGLTLVAVLALILLGLFFGATRVVAELGSLSRSLPSFYLQARELVDKTLAMVEQVARNLPPDIEASLMAQVKGLYDTLGDWVNLALKSLQDLAFGRLPGLLTNLLVTLVASFFISRDRRLIWRFILRLAPPSWRGGLQRARAEILAATVGLVNAQLVLVLLTTLVTIIGLALLKTGYALSLGILAGLLDVIPVIGPSVIFVPWIVYHLLFGNITQGLLLGVLYLGVSGVRSLAQAYIIGERIGIHPLAILVALYLGLKIFGPIGLAVGPLMAIILKAAVRSGLLPIFHE